MRVKGRELQECYEAVEAVTETVKNLHEREQRTQQRAGEDVADYLAASFDRLISASYDLRTAARTRLGAEALERASSAAARPEERGGE